jgi:ATP-binding protein involved in chromosome partitioning
MSPDPRFEPVEIGPNDDGTRLRIRWKDGVVSEYVPRYLRLLCPCAGCVDEMTGVRTLIEERVDPDVYPTAIHYVGRYALQLIWSDGHSTGIYTFEYLRGLWDAEPPDAGEAPDRQRPLGEGGS